MRIIFNYSDALLQVPPDVTVHTSSPAVDLLYALYFYLTWADFRDARPRAVRRSRAAQEVFESSRDFTVGLEEEFALLDPRTLSMTNAFERWRRRPPGRRAVRFGRG